MKSIFDIARTNTATPITNNHIPTPGEWVTQRPAVCIPGRDGW